MQEEADGGRDLHPGHESQGGGGDERAAQGGPHPRRPQGEQLRVQTLQNFLWNQTEIFATGLLEEPQNLQSLLQRLP